MLRSPADDDLEIAIFAANTIVTRALRDGEELLVGRDDVCAVRLDDGSVSRRHASLRRDGNVVRVSDLGSANGTFLRDAGPGETNATLRMRPVRSAVSVKVGTVLHFGAVLAIVRRASERQGLTIASREPAMQAVYERAHRAAGSLISVLLLGETGVGKEVLARTIHERSPRATKHFMALNCGALAPTLVESELFGHEKGAFTGATHAKEGLLESANGGTVFLDEIGELPLEVQVKLLRVLEERVVLSVGGRTPRAIDVRIISATHRDIEADCRAGKFREDLFFRLAGMSLTIPPLRERVSEIPELAALFLTRSCASAGRTVPALSESSARLLARYPWPGNVRELRNAMDLAAVLCAGDEVRPEHLPDKLRALASAGPDPKSGETERTRVTEALERCGGNQTQAAALLGVSRRTLVSRLTEYGMTQPRKPRA